MLFRLLPKCFAGCLLIFQTCMIYGLSFAQEKSSNLGLSKPQDEATLPRSKAVVVKSVRKPKLEPKTVLLKQGGEQEYVIRGGWELAEAAALRLQEDRISGPKINTSQWFNATVPGTVLTTLVDQGVYPDPYWGINNLSIPDSLCRKPWWYRTEFTLPVAQRAKTCWLLFKGINYQAEVWLNGQKIGTLKGAFQRGEFKINRYIKSTGLNVLAIKIIPPPHPGIPHEQSVRAQRGPNGGALCQDGPTFISSEGWDWIPGIRDRNIGLWQDVALRFTDDVQIIDPQIITDLPLPDTSKADIRIKTRLFNSGDQQASVTLQAQFAGVSVSLPVLLKPRETRTISLTPDQFKQLSLHHPKLWWPNGYGAPNLYHLRLSVSRGATVSDIKTISFGVREYSYEMSVDAPGKKNWRVDYDPTNVFQQTSHPLFDNAERRTVTGETVIPALHKGVDASLLKEISDPVASPYLVVKINGRRIFCKGGNWGMDDGMKRTSRKFLEPFFKLSRDANFNMIRNWTGESTEETFYELCDEYGLMVWNDFWISTENYNLLPADYSLFLRNASDVIRRFRNHPSIAIWCPRNEGFVPPALEMPLAQMVADEDGTRLYQPNSRYMNLRTSGPWNYQKDASVYFTRIADGFSTELGSTSVPTAATMRKMMAPEDLWPIGDVWHYHDFHFGQLDYVRAIDSLYGKATGLDDFCRKAQLVNFDSHRAMFESWNSKLWQNASGMLIWMSQPAWPSTVWQAYSSDYETFGSYFGLRSACEPIHIQMNPTDNQVIVANASLKDLPQAEARLETYDLQGRRISFQQTRLTASANRLTHCFTGRSPNNDQRGVYLVRLQLTDQKGKLVSHNDYWKTGKDGNYQQFNQLAPAELTANVIRHSPGRLMMQLKNASLVPCIGIKLNLQNKVSRELMLPAYFSEGYFTLLPGESRIVEVSFPASAAVHVLAGGYNFPEKNIMEVPAR